MTATAAATRRRRGRPPVAFDEDAVLDATIAALARGDREPVTMETLATGAGVAKTTLHDRYGGKAGLVALALERERERLAAHLVASYQEARDDLRPGAAVRRGYAALFDWARANPDSFRLLFGPTAAPQAQTRALVADRIAEIVGERFAAAGLPLTTSRAIIAAVIVGAGESVARIVAADASIDLDAVTELVAGLITNGLANTDPDAVRAVDGG